MSDPKEELARLREIAERRGERREVGLLELDEKRLAEEEHEPVRYGPGFMREPVPVDFDVEEQRAAGVRPDAVPYGRPRWAIELVGERVSPERMVETLVERIRTEPNEKLLRQAELMLRDLSRDERGKELLRQYVSQDLVARLTSVDAEGGER